jgi:hypothetical protein
MAVLSNADRLACWAEVMRDVTNINGAAGAVSKADLRAAIDATDQWIDDNATSYNQALPATVRTAFSAKQKAILYSIVSLKRYGVL